MWGRRWARPPDQEAGGGQGPAVIHERKFWEGSLFGVALGASSFPGIIAVHADADYVLNFRKEIGVEAQVEELGRQSGVAEVALLSPDLTILAHSDPRRIGQHQEDAELRRVLGDRKSLSRFVPRDGRDVFEILRPVVLNASGLGLLRISLSTDTMTEAWRQDLRGATLLGVTILLVGALGLGFIFYIQERHLREVRRLEAEVERRERLSVLGNLAAIVGHEVRNPLNAISMGLQRLRREFRPQGEPDEYARMMELMQGEVKRLNAIVEEFLSLARPVPLKLESVRVEELLREVTTLVGADAEGRGVHLSLHVPPDLLAVRLDPNHMKQVFLNLVMNAFDAMPHGGELTLGASASRDSATVTVEDTGRGIAPDLLPTIFEPYVTTKVKGMGLGLAIARKIVEAHGGRIDVASRPGQGTRFAVVLPLNSPPVESHG
jgi:two-component system sensor histidine kinase HydH